MTITSDKVRTTSNCGESATVAKGMYLACPVSPTPNCGESSTTSNPSRLELQVSTTPNVVSGPREGRSVADFERSVLPRIVGSVPRPNNDSDCSIGSGLPPNGRERATCL